MHDTFLLNNISKLLGEICEQSKILKIDWLTIVVNHNSHVNEENLREHLLLNNANLLNSNFKIKVKREDIEEQTAIIQSIQGETFGD
ncbi:MAG: hypothetical protein PHE29_02780 [Tissierellia bacterium]|nr:hypothetical protein [Tissierellia bacterium]MDD4779784.1 hypothetical protein [Tissierellia bacterium]